MIKMNIAAVLLICGISFVIGAVCMQLTCKASNESLQYQIAIRDTVNAQNIRIHKRDSTRIEWLFTHDRK